MSKEPIRVAHIIGKWLGGGVESVVMNYYRNIDRSKIQFDFICDSDSTNIPYDEIEKLGGNVIIVPPYKKIISYRKELLKVFKANKYKIVHSHINVLSVFSLGVAKKACIPIRIAHSHSTTNRAEKIKNLLKITLKKFSRVYSTNYFSCSELAGRWLFGNKTYNNGKVYVLNNAIDLEKFKYKKNVRKKIRKDLGIEENTIVIGNVGRFVTQKNHVFLINMFYEYHKRNPNSVLLLIGEGTLMTKIKDMVNSLNIYNSVLFLGQRNNTNEFYQAMDVFALPSLYEGLGMVLIEAQASGLPCVASDNVPIEASVSELVKYKKLDSIDNWCNAIDMCSKIPRVCKDISNSGYDIKTESRKLEKVYVDLYNGK